MVKLAKFWATHEMMSLRHISAMLFKANFKTVTGKAFSPSAVKSMIKS